MVQANRADDQGAKKDSLPTGETRGLLMPDALERMPRSS